MKTPEQLIYERINATGAIVGKWANIDLDDPAGTAILLNQQAIMLVLQKLLHQNNSALTNCTKGSNENLHYCSR